MAGVVGSRRQAGGGGGGGGGASFWGGAGSTGKPARGGVFDGHEEVFATGTRARFFSKFAKSFFLPLNPRRAFSLKTEAAKNNKRIKFMKTAE